jgi:site-specific DNA-methyltransferase (adenine-specific)
LPGNSEVPLDQILVGDCLDILSGMQAESVDLVFADPPYNLQLKQELWRPNNTRVDAVDDAWDQFPDFKTYDQFTRDWLDACRRVLKPSGTLWVIGTYHNIFRVGVVLQDLGFWILNEVVWVKNNPMPNFRGVRLTNAHETLIWAQKTRGVPYTFNYHALKSANDNLQMRSDWYLPICTGSERLKINGEKAHSTQKPEALLYRILQSSSNPGDVVLDPFFGTGTTGVVAKRLHRHWIGIEREQAYVELAQLRIAEEPEPVQDLSVFRTPNPRKRRRVPFGMLLEYGFLKPGQMLYFERTEKIARVQSDGSIVYNGQRGSIHQVARQLRQGPCNGWDLWFYINEDSGEKCSIDSLRQALYQQIGIDLQSGYS